ncbi:MAG: ERF family protein [Gallionella sp.]|nr:ERF family protein [Gallionella sp.]
MNTATKEEGRVIEVAADSFSRKEDRAMPAVIEPGQATPMSMLAMAVKQGMSLDTIKELRALQKEYEADEARKAYNAAFSAFRAEAVKVIKGTTYGSGPLAGKKYAELYSVVNAVTPALSQNGLSASWKLTKDDKDWLEVTCTLRHVLGHSESVSMGGPPDSGGAKSPIQARVSSVTFLERYTLKAICGVSEQGDDKDGGDEKRKVEPDAEGKAKLEACASLSSLAEAWKALTAAQRATLNESKNECKARIQEADRAAQ